MNDRWLQVLPDAGAAAHRAADVVAGRLLSAVAAKGRFRVALSGGSTPIPMFEALASKSLPWRQVEIYQVDDRVAPLGSPQRNLTAILDIFGDVGATIMAMPVDSDDQEAAAERYEQALPHVFDLVHLGLGRDGSTASLFPGDAALEVSDRDVALCGPRMGTVGMTLTYRGLSKAAEILWLVTGTDKAAPLASLCTAEPGVPAARVASIRTRVVVDAAAARDLEAHPQTGVHLWHRDEAARDSNSIDK